MGSVSLKHTMQTNHTILPSRFTFNQLDQVLNRLWGETVAHTAVTQPFPTDTAVPVDLHEDQTHYHAHFDLPGVRKEELSVKIQKGILEVSGTSQNGQGNYSQSTSFKRELLLPEDAVSDDITARFENGVLHLAVAKATAPQPKTITIN